jgi:hypothetical protein
VWQQSSVAGWWLFIRHAYLALDIHLREQTGFRYRLSFLATEKAESIKCLEHQNSSFSRNTPKKRPYSAGRLVCLRKRGRFHEPDSKQRDNRSHGLEGLQCRQSRQSSNSHPSPSSAINRSHGLEWLQCRQSFQSSNSHPSLCITCSSKKPSRARNGAIRDRATSETHTISAIEGGGRRRTAKNV